MNIVVNILIAILIAILVFLIAAFLLGLLGIGQPWPSLLGLLAGVLYFAQSYRRI